MEESKLLTQFEQLHAIKTKPQFHDTKADGNCFFHAAFGVENPDSGLYEAEKAENMRRDWFNFLSQYRSLRDMPARLREQSEKIFNIMLHNPSQLTGRVDKIKELVSQTKKSIDNTEKRIKKLKLSIYNRFHDDDDVHDEVFRNDILQIIRQAYLQGRKEPPTLEDLQSDLGRSLEEIVNQLEDCALKFDPNLTPDQYKIQYTIDPIVESFLENSTLYENYLEAIKSSDYYVFIEEIGIIASLAKIEIVVLRYEEGKGQIREGPFVPDEALVGNYQSDRNIWGSRTHAVIYHEGLHYSHVSSNDVSTKRKAADEYEYLGKKAKLSTPEDRVIASIQASIEKIKLTSSNEFLDGLTMPSEGLRFNAHGVVFQLKLLMLCLWRASHSEENDQIQFKRFRLATEMPEAQKFDDSVFQYVEDSINKWKFRLMQAKHKEKENPQDPLPKIELKDLLSVSDEEDFSLQKYFHSYLKIKQRTRENSVYSVFSESKIEDVIVITNTDLDPDLKPDKENSIFIKDSKDITCDSLFKTDKKGTSIYKLKFVGKEEDELKVIFKITSNFYRLIVSLADHWCTDKQLNTKKQINKVEVFKEYYHPLRNEIIDVNGSKSCGYSFNLNKLIDKKSLDGEDLSAEAVEIRNALIIEMAFRKGNIKLPVIDSCELPTDQTERDNLAANLANRIVNGEELTKRDLKNYHDAFLYHIINSDEKKLRSKFTKEVETPSDKQKEPSMLGKFKSSLKISLGKCSNKSVTNAYLEEVTIQIADDFGRDSAKTASGLAKNLVRAMKNNEIISILDFEDYHVGLAQEVVDVKTRIFRKKFINGHDGKEELSAAAKNLRRALIDEMYNENINIVIGDSEIAFQKFKDLDAALVRKLFGSSKIKVSEGFATDFHPNHTPVIDDVVLFAKQMQMLLDKEQKVVEVNCQMKAKLKMSDESFKTFNSNVKKLAGYVFINRFRKVRFSTAFLEQSDLLPENVKIFIDKLKSLLGNDHFSSLRNVELKFDRDFETCDDGELFRKLPVLHNDADVTKFFELLKFVVGYPNRFEIDDLLGEEIKDKIKKLDGKAFKSMYCENLHNWMADRVGTFYTTRKAETLFQEIQNNLSLWTIDGCNKPYFSKASQEYKFKRYHHFVEFLLSENQVLHLVFEDLALGRTRIVQTFCQLKKEDASSMQKYTRGFGHIFLYLNQLNDIEFCSEINQVFAIKSNFNLVVIECNTRSNLPTLCNRLQTLLKNRDKIIFITTDSCDELAKHFGKGDSKKDSTSFDDIEDDQSKKRLFQEPVVILQKQPKKISFSELMCISNMDEFLSSEQVDLNKIMSTETLIKFIKDETINIGRELVKSKGYDKSYYISRSFEPVILDEEKIQHIIKTNSGLKSDLFVVNGTNTKLSGKNIWVFNEDAIEPARIQFEGLCNKHKKLDVHWLVRDSEKLTWNTSKSSVSNLRNYREKTVDIKDLIDEEKLVTESHNRIVIIADAAGTGKSTVLTDLSSKIKNNDPNVWVIRIDLNDLSGVLEREYEKSKFKGFRYYDLSTAVDFLVNNLLASQDKLKLSTELEKEVLKHCFYGRGKIALLLDGFDELKSDFNVIIIPLLVALKESEVEKLVVTTRPIIKELLENRLGVFSVALKPFSEEDRMKFFIKFWTKKLKFESLNQEKEKRLVTYAKSIVNKFSSLIGNDQNFISIPLHTKMLAEIFQSDQNDERKTWQGCKEFFNSKQDETPQLPEKFNISDLYERFVEKKYYDIHLKVKKGRQFSKPGEKESADKTYKDFISNHEILAMHRLFRRQDLGELLSQEKIQEIITAIRTLKENEGIIYDFVNNEPRFIHLTFAEYFAANFVWQNQQDQTALQKLIVTNILIKSDFKRLRIFVYEYKKKKKLANAVWDETILKLLDTAYFYEGDTADDRNLLEKIVGQAKPNKEHIHDLFKVLNEQECDQLTMNELITNSCFEYVIKKDYLNFFDILDLFIEKIDDPRLLSALHDVLLEKLASNRSFCYESEEYFINLMKKRITGPQLKELFHCPRPWDKLAKGNFGFTNLVESLLSKRSRCKVITKYWPAISDTLKYRLNSSSPTPSPDPNYYALEQYLDGGDDEGYYANKLQHLDDEENDAEKLPICSCDPNDDWELRYHWSMK